MLKDPLTVLYDSVSSIIGEPKDLKGAIDSKETFETNPKAIEIPQPAKAIVIEKKVVSPVNQPQELANKEPEPVKQQDEPVVLKTAHVDLASSNYMPIKALNTFTRDWCIKARVANRGDMRQT